MSVIDWHIQSLVTPEMEAIKEWAKPCKDRPIITEEMISVARIRHQMLSQFRAKLMGEALRAAKKRALA